MTQLNADPTLKIIQELPNAWFQIAAIYNAVNEYNYETIPGNYREDTKSKVDSLTLGLIVVYLFALLESYIAWDDWKIYNEDYAIRLKAYRYIRHSFAHSPDGKRAKLQYAQFDLIMQSQEPLKGVRIENGDYIRIDLASIEELVSIMRHTAHIFIRDKSIQKHYKQASSSI